MRSETRDSVALGMREAECKQLRLTLSDLRNKHEKLLSSTNEFCSLVESIIFSLEDKELSRESITFALRAYCAELRSIMWDIGEEP